jgi:hypothetical protein
MEAEAGVENEPAPAAAPLRIGSGSCSERDCDSDHSECAELHGARLFIVTCATHSMAATRLTMPMWMVGTNIVITLGGTMALAGPLGRSRVPKRPLQ